jgi:hypothetical protein
VSECECECVFLLAESSGASQESAGWGDLFSSSYSRTVFIGCMMFVLQQCSGINAIVYFSSAVFKQVRGCSSCCQCHGPVGGGGMAAGQRHDSLREWTAG